MVRTAIDGICSVETDAEVVVDTRRIDLWFTPIVAHASLPAHLGLLGRITNGSGTIEFFHNTPNGKELASCLVKHGDFRHSLTRRKKRALPVTQWVISSGRPDAGIAGLAFHPTNRWPQGVYSGPRLLWTRLVVVNELPVERNTLLLRLLGAGAVLRKAIAELQELPADQPERKLALPILINLRLAVPTDPALQTSNDKEFLMDTLDLAEAWRRELIQEGVKQGLVEGVKQGLEEGVKQGREEGVKLAEAWRREAIQEGVKQGLVEGVKQGLVEGVKQGLEEGVKQGREGGVACSLIVVYEARFDAMPKDLRAIVESTHDEDTLRGWLRLAGTRDASEVAAAIRGFQVALSG